MSRSDADTEYTDFVRSRLPQWRRTAVLMSGDWDAGDDLVQRVLTELYRKWPRLRSADNLDGLVRTMLLRRLIETRRVRWSRVQLWASVPEQAIVAGPDASERLDVINALQQVPARQRAVLVLRYFQDLSVAETAAALDCSTGNVKSQSARGLATLRRLLSPPGAED